MSSAVKTLKLLIKQNPQETKKDLRCFVVHPMIDHVIIASSHLVLPSIAQHVPHLDVLTFDWSLVGLEMYVTAKELVRPTYALGSAVANPEQTPNLWIHETLMRHRPEKLWKSEAEEEEENNSFVPESNAYEIQIAAALATCRLFLRTKSLVAFDETREACELLHLQRNRIRNKFGKQTVEISTNLIGLCTKLAVSLRSGK